MKRILSLLLALVAIVLGVTVTLAQSGYNLDWFTTSGGGGETRGGVYTLTGAVGQAEAGTLSGGAYTLGGGFLVGGASSPALLYLPLINR